MDPPEMNFPGLLLGFTDGIGIDFTIAWDYRLHQRYPTPRPRNQAAINLLNPIEYLD